MARNKYIYAQSDGTVIIRSDKKGRTWSGANENLRNSWCPAFCWDKPEYDGNQELIRLGCNPIDEAWDGNPAAKDVSALSQKEDENAGSSEQLLIPGFE